MGRPQQTHCKRGHEFTPENTMRHATGKRCRACNNAAAKIRYNADPALRAKIKEYNKNYRIKLKAIEEEIKNVETAYLDFGNV